MTLSLRVQHGCLGNDSHLTRAIVTFSPLFCSFVTPGEMQPENCSGTTEGERLRGGEDPNLNISHPSTQNPRVNKARSGKTQQGAQKGSRPKRESYQVQNGSNNVVDNAAARQENGPKVSQDFESTDSAVGRETTRTARKAGTSAPKSRVAAKDVDQGHSLLMLPIEVISMVAEYLITMLSIEHEVVVTDTEHAIITSSLCNAFLSSPHTPYHLLDVNSNRTWWTNESNALRNTSAACHDAVTLAASRLQLATPIHVSLAVLGCHPHAIRLNKWIRSVIKRNSWGFEIATAFKAFVAAVFPYVGDNCFTSDYITDLCARQGVLALRPGSTFWAYEVETRNAVQGVGSIVAPANFYHSPFHVKPSAGGSGGIALEDIKRKLRPFRVSFKAGGTSNVTPHFWNLGGHIWIETKVPGDGLCAAHSFAHLHSRATGDSWTARRIISDVHEFLQSHIGDLLATAQEKKIDNSVERVVAEAVLQECLEGKNFSTDFIHYAAMCYGVQANILLQGGRTGAKTPANVLCEGTPGAEFLFPFRRWDVECYNFILRGGNVDHSNNHFNPIVLSPLKKGKGAVVKAKLRQFDSDEKDDSGSDVSTVEQWIGASALVQSVAAERPNRIVRLQGKERPCWVYLNHIAFVQPEGTKVNPDVAGDLTLEVIKKRSRIERLVPVNCELCRNNQLACKHKPAGLKIGTPINVRLRIATETDCGDVIPQQPHLTSTELHWVPCSRRDLGSLAPLLVKEESTKNQKEGEKKKGTPISGTNEETSKQSTASSKGQPEETSKQAAAGSKWKPKQPASDPKEQHPEMRDQETTTVPTTQTAGVSTDYDELWTTDKIARRRLNKDKERPKPSRSEQFPCHGLKRVFRCDEGCADKVCENARKAAEEQVRLRNVVADLRLRLYSETHDPLSSDLPVERSQRLRRLGVNLGDSKRIHLARAVAVCERTAMMATITHTPYAYLAGLWNQGLLSRSEAEQFALRIFAVQSVSLKETLFQHALNFNRVMMTWLGGAVVNHADRQEATRMLLVEVVDRTSASLADHIVPPHWRNIQPRGFKDLHRLAQSLARTPLPLFNFGVWVENLKTLSNGFPGAVNLDCGAAAVQANNEPKGYVRCEEFSGNCAIFVRLLWREVVGETSKPWFLPDCRTSLATLLDQMFWDTGVLPQSIHLVDQGHRTVVPVTAPMTRDAALVVHVHRSAMQPTIGHCALLLPEAVAFATRPNATISELRDWVRKVRSRITGETFVGERLTCTQPCETRGTRIEPYEVDARLVYCGREGRVRRFLFGNRSSITILPAREIYHFAICDETAAKFVCHCIPAVESTRCFCSHNSIPLPGIRIENTALRRGTPQELQTCEQSLRRYPTTPEAPPSVRAVLTIQADRFEQKVHRDHPWQIDATLLAAVQRNSFLQLSNVCDELRCRFSNLGNARVESMDYPRPRRSAIDHFDALQAALNIQLLGVFDGYKERCACGAVAQSEQLCSWCSTVRPCKVCQRPSFGIDGCALHGRRKGDTRAFVPRPAVQQMAVRFIHGQRLLQFPGCQNADGMALPTVAGVAFKDPNPDATYTAYKNSDKAEKSFMPARVLGPLLDSNPPIVLTPTTPGMIATSTARAHRKTTAAANPLAKEFQLTMQKYFARKLRRDAVNLPPVRSKAFLVLLREAMLQSHYPKGKTQSILAAWNNICKFGWNPKRDFRLKGMAKWEKKSGFFSLVMLGFVAPSDVDKLVDGPVERARVMQAWATRSDSDIQELLQPGPFECPLSYVTNARLIQFYSSNAMTAVQMVITHQMAKWMKNEFCVGKRMVCGGGRDAVDAAVVFKKAFEHYRPAYVHSVDQSKFDSNQAGPIFDFTWNLRRVFANNYYSDPLFKQYFDHLTEDCQVVDVVGSGQRRLFKVKTPHVRKSGDPYTYIDNTLTVFACLMYCSAKIYANANYQGVHPPLEDLVDASLEFHNLVAVVSSDDQVVGSDSPWVLTALSGWAEKLGLPVTGNTPVPFDQLHTQDFLAGRVIETAQGPLSVPDLMRWTTSIATKLNPNVADQDWRDSVYTGWRFLEKLPIYRVFLEYLSRSATRKKYTIETLAAVDKDAIHKLHRFAPGAFTPNPTTFQQMADIYTCGSVDLLHKVEEALRATFQGKKGGVVFRCPIFDWALSNVIMRAQ